jgi:hypothetical protein
MTFNVQMEVGDQEQQLSCPTVQEQENRRPTNEKRPSSVLTNEKRPGPDVTNEERQIPEVLAGSPANETVNRKRRAIFSRVFSTTYLPQNSIAHKRYGTVPGIQYGTVAGTERYPVRYGTRYGTVPGTVRYPVRYGTRYGSTPSKARHGIARHDMIRYSTTVGTLRYRHARLR